MGEVLHLGLNLEAADVTGQHGLRVKNFPPEATVGELIRGLVGKMNLNSKDSGGRDYTYHALLEREGRHLHASETVGDALEEGDRIVLQPNIDAGFGRG
jgi:predicted transcriptional regulator